MFPLVGTGVIGNTFHIYNIEKLKIVNDQIPINVVICPRAGRAFTLFIRVVSVLIGPHDPLRSTKAAESKQSARLCRLIGVSPQTLTYSFASDHNLFLSGFGDFRFAPIALMQKSRPEK